MSTMRVYTREFRESAVGLMLSQGLSIRVAAEDLGMPYHTLHSWVRDKRRTLRKTIVKAPPKTMVDAQARVRELEAVQDPIVDTSLCVNHAASTRKLRDTALATRANARARDKHLSRRCGHMRDSWPCERDIEAIGA